MKQLSNEAILILFSQVVTVAAGIAFLCVMLALTERHDTAIQGPR